MDQTHKHKSSLAGEVMLLLTAILWGAGFSAQRQAMLFIGPFTFIAIRFLLGGMTLLPFLWLTRHKNKYGKSGPKDKVKETLIASLACGSLLFIGTSFQQVGLVSTSASKAGFITALYIVLVPIFGLFIGKKVSKNVWVALVLAVAGLYLLTISSKFSVSKGDFVVLAGAGVWALHILTIDHFNNKVDAFKLAFGQFLVTAILGTIVGLSTEAFTFQGLASASWALLYAGVAVVGIAFTLQVIGQKTVQPSIAALILSLEAVFAVLGGMLILGENLSTREWVGCALMMAAVLLAQLKATASSV